jgi:hypothetical protein
MRVRWLLVLMSAGLIAAGAWGYDIYMGQLNNMIALQSCVQQIEQERREKGSLPVSSDCADFWGRPVTYSVRSGTYVLVSAGSDGQMEANYGSFEPGDIPWKDTCLARGADTVFVGRNGVRCCSK